jgi:hypothetical protein
MGNLKPLHGLLKEEKVKAYIESPLERKNSAPPMVQHRLLILNPQARGTILSEEGRTFMHARPYQALPETSCCEARKV